MECLCAPCDALHALTRLSKHQADDTPIYGVKACDLYVFALLETSHLLQRPRESEQPMLRQCTIWRGDVIEATGPLRHILYIWALVSVQWRAVVWKWYQCTSERIGHSSRLLGTEDRRPLRN